MILYRCSKKLQISGQELEKEKKMEGMTNEQFQAVLKMIIQIIESSKTKEEAIEKIKDLLK